MIHGEYANENGARTPHNNFCYKRKWEHEIRDLMMEIVLNEF
jgi:hypothetical protein